MILHFIFLNYNRNNRTILLKENNFVGPSNKLCWNLKNNSTVAKNVDRFSN